MIKSDKGTVTIDGERIHILLDFAHIYTDLIDAAPEIVQAVTLHYQDKLLNAKVDRAGFVICESLLNTLHTIESEDKDDESSIL